MTTYIIHVPKENTQALNLPLKDLIKMDDKKKEEVAVVKSDCLMDLTIEFGDNKFNVKITEFKKLYQLNKFTSVTVFCIPMRKYKLVITVDASADLENDRQIWKKELETIMHNSTSTIEEVKLAIQKYDRMDRLPQYYSYMSSTDRQLIKKVTFEERIFSANYEAGLDLKITMIVEDESLLPKIK